MQSWELKIELKVSDNWVADGFDVHDERLKEIEEMLQGLLPYAFSYVEVKVKASVVKAPDPKIIAKIQEGE